MKTAIRLDDITPDMDWEKFQQAETILDTFQVKPLIGVVPFNEDPNLKRGKEREDFARVVTDLQSRGFSIALHGYKHIYVNRKGGLFPLNDLSEYAGLPLETQERMLAEGKEQLKAMGIDTDIFMAPAHSYDKNTLRALQNTGFHYVTDGFGKRPYLREGLTFLPIAVKRTDCIADKAGYTTLVLHTNTMEQAEFTALEKMLREHREHFISYDELMQVKAENRNALGSLWEHSLARTKFFAVKLRAVLKQSGKGRKE